MKDLIDRNIEVLINRRNSIINNHTKNHIEDTNNYSHNYIKEIDDLKYDILNIIYLNINLLEVDIVLETLTQLGHASSVVCDDGKFVILDHNPCKQHPIEISYSVCGIEWSKSIRLALDVYLKYINPTLHKGIKPKKCLL